MAKFDRVECQHIYREFNQEVDQLSKRDLHLSKGIIMIEEFKNYTLVQECSHNVFMSFTWLLFSSFLQLLSQQMSILYFSDVILVFLRGCRGFSGGFVVFGYTLLVGLFFMNTLVVFF